MESLFDFSGKMVLFVLVLSLLVTNHANARLRIAAASDLKFALTEVIEAFEEKDVEVSFGSSGHHTAQLLQGAPFDLFLSAGSDYTKKVIEAGYAESQEEFKYAEGRIVLWALKSSPFQFGAQGLSILTDPSVHRVAIAQPTHAPYGKAAEQALQNSGLYPRVKDKLTFGENVAQAAQFVEKGPADIGIIALSLAKAPEMEKRGRYWIVPAAFYTVLNQTGVLLKNTPNRKSAEKFRDFLLGKKSRGILENYGLGEQTPQQPVFKKIGN